MDHFSEYHMTISESGRIKHMTNMYTASQHPYKYPFSRHQKLTTTSLSRQSISVAGTPIHRDLKNPHRLKAKSGVLQAQQQTTESETNRVDNAVQWFLSPWKTRWIVRGTDVRDALEILWFIDRLRFVGISDPSILAGVSIEMHRSIQTRNHSVGSRVSTTERQGLMVSRA